MNRIEKNGIYCTTFKEKSKVKLTRKGTRMVECTCMQIHALWSKGEWQIVG